MKKYTVKYKLYNGDVYQGTETATIDAKTFDFRKTHNSATFFDEDGSALAAITNVVSITTHDAFNVVDTKLTPC